MKRMDKRWLERDRIREEKRARERKIVKKQKEKVASPVEKEKKTEWSEGNGN